MWIIWDNKENKEIGKAKTLDEAEKKLEDLVKEDPSLLEEDRVDFQ